ncbi:RNA methyltransferase [Mongoliitalea daihaiensis]|uniref:RNA methyltransferase n=1 Tax=Mongoliitalea daihaiensis TaxID=2782006 RepID=UPI001F30AE68|nr:RNA methyltransferase [Mongoliitalea daihaiensis]UJP67106.1 RNA methyltransferase [Mongoliitalea daihaiensis]
MLSKNTLKFIKSLHQKKFRKQEQSFFVEGSKNVLELLCSDYEISHLLITEKFEQEHSRLLQKYARQSIQVKEQDLIAAGTFQSNDAALAVAKIKANEAFDLGVDEWALALDDVRDPGNLGTIIRIADWYGIQKIILSEESADFYNPKVLNASMGSFSRVKIHYCDLQAYLKNVQQPIYGAFLDGQNIYAESFPRTGILVMGNESQGISREVEKFVNRRISIPAFGKAESLNVAIATAVCCDNIRRQQTPVVP